MKVVKKLFRILLIPVMALMLNACDHVSFGLEFGSGTNDYREATNYICSYVWTDEWRDDFGKYYYQEIRFFPDGRGEECMLTEDRFGFRQEARYAFVWDWWDTFYTSIRLTYGKGDYSYMENIRAERNRLECLYDGTPAYFIGR